VLGYHQQTCRMQLLSLHPGVTLAQVESATDFDLGASDPLPTTAAPTEHELELLRREVDPHRYLLGR
jgi:glutaconate CoA-transferase subunit B